MNYLSPKELNELLTQVGKAYIPKLEKPKKPSLNDVFFWKRKRPALVKTKREKTKMEKIKLINKLYLYIYYKWLN